MKDLEARKERGEFERLPKKEAQHLQDELDRLERVLGGIRDMRRLPGAIFVVDTKKEHTAVLEANRLEIPVVALADTNTDPDEMDYPIPANDDAIRAVRLLCSKIADAALEGLRQRDSQRQKDDGDTRAATQAPVTLEEFGGEPASDSASEPTKEATTPAAPAPVATPVAEQAEEPASVGE
jgi:small subunit ribosomal protein S2